MKRLVIFLSIGFGLVACKEGHGDKASTGDSGIRGAPSNPERTHPAHPSFESWSRVTVGMSEGEVIKILGKPLDGSSWDDYKALPNSENAQYQWSYGSLYARSDSHPFSSDFDVVFRKGLVVRLSDLFGGSPVRSSGRPQAPKLFIPANNSTFEHFPRILDLRWWASSGNLPITYEVSVEVKYPNGEWGIEKDLQQRADSLHIAMIFPGANEGRWRVRGLNQDGAGDWSDYSGFKFTR